MQIVKDVLRSLSLTGTYKGFYLINDGVAAIAKDENAIFTRSKGLYIDLAKKHNTSVKCVEKNIRTAITIIWDRGDHELLNAIAGYIVITKPTVAEMLDILSSYVMRQAKG